MKGLVSFIGIVINKEIYLENNYSMIVKLKNGRTFVEPVQSKGKIIILDDNEELEGIKICNEIGQVLYRYNH